jgi:hypothetical protein
MINKIFKAIKTLIKIPYLRKNIYYDYANIFSLFNCPNCGKQFIKIFVDESNYGGKHNIFVPVFKCKSCNFTWTNSLSDDIYQKNLELIQSLLKD